MDEQHLLDRYLIQGIDFQKNGRFSEAEQAYLSALELQSQHPVANNNLGFLYAEQQHWQQAVNYFEIAINSDPNNFMAHTNLGQVLILTAQVEKGLAHLYKAIEINSKSLQSYDTLASMLQWLGQLPQAQGYWQITQTLSDNDVHYALKTALCIALQGNHSEAILRFKEIIKTHPQTQQAWTYLGISYLVSQDTQNAEHALLQALQLDSTDTNALKHLALLKLATNQLASAIDYYQQLLSITPDNHDSRLDMAITLLATGESSLALSHIERLIEANQTQPKVRYYRALCLRQLDQFDKAEGILTSLAVEESEFAIKAAGLIAQGHP